MATQYLTIDPLSGTPDPTNPPGITQTNGSSFPIVGVAFDGTTGTNEHMYYMLRAINYDTGNLTLDVDWYAASTDAETCVWACQIAVVTPDEDVNLATKALATVQQAADANLGTTANRPQRAAITISNLDSLAQDDIFVLKLTREQDDASDDLAEDAILLGLTLSYTSV